MIKQRLYLKLCIVFAASLAAFAIFAGFLWSAMGHERYEHAIFHKTTALAAMLLPPADADPGVQAQAVERIAAALDFGVTLWSRERQLVASTGSVGRPSVDRLEPGSWIGAKGGTQWTAVLPDGRWVVIDLDRMALPSDSVGIALSLVLLAAFVALITYPFIRHITRRLERLQREVVRIGSGDLGARVEIRGNDEIALLAGSFNEAAERIEKLVTAQRMLLANASHELRTPLARIRLGIEMLLQHDEPARRTALEKDIQELSALIDELILMTRLDTGLNRARFQPIDLVALAAEECARYRGCSFSGRAAQLPGDRRMLQHLVRNLIDNAFTHGAPPVDVTIRQSADRVELIVSDEGRGIPESEKEKVFQPFYRAVDKQNVPGYGLGLPLVRRIAEMHGGAVSISTRPKSSVKVVFEAPAGLPQEGFRGERERLTL